MRLPVLNGLIRRRLLVNFRVDAEVMGCFPPAPFRPKRQQGYAIAGICLIRLEQVRPLAVERVESSFFANQSSFPAGSVTFDHALIMRDISHRWLGEPDLFYPTAVEHLSEFDPARMKPTRGTDEYGLRAALRSQS